MSCGSIGRVANKKSKWDTENDLELTRLWDEGLSVRLLAKHFKISVGSIGRAVRRLGLDLRGSPVDRPNGSDYYNRPRPDFSFPDFKEEP